MNSTKIALIGIGKIARDQHVPHLNENDAFDLCAAVTSHTPPDGVPGYRSLQEMLDAKPDVTAVSICTPPIGRLSLITEALSLGLDVMVEKPPAATMSEARRYVEIAAQTDRVLYVTWHSREAAAVHPAKKWLADKTIKSVTTHWKEDVRIWHPGQEWIWGTGLGVFDPGINAISVLTKVLPAPVLVSAADLRFPENKDGPIAADLDMTCGDNIPIRVEFDFDQAGPQIWDIVIETNAGTIALTHGASKMSVNGADIEIPDDPEYRRLYRRFAELLATRQTDADLTPFQLVTDAFHIGKRSTVAPFTDF